MRPKLQRTAQGIYSLFPNIDYKKSTGTDGVRNSFLECYGEMFSQHLFVLFSSPLNQRRHLRDWFNAIVVRVHKSGDKRLRTNYSPISLTSSCYRLLEHVLPSHISHFLEFNQILVDILHGFGKQLSTSAQLNSGISDCPHDINNNQQLDAIFMTLQRSLTVSLSVFSSENLRRIGIAQEHVYWVEAHPRTESIFLKLMIDGRSTFLSVTAGVPQRSVLGPILFLFGLNWMYAWMS